MLSIVHVDMASHPVAPEASVGADGPSPTMEIVSAELDRWLTGDGDRTLGRLT